MKRPADSPNRIVTARNENEDCSDPQTPRKANPVHSARTYRIVNSPQRRRTLPLPDWVIRTSRQPNGLKIPQLTPELLMVPLENLVGKEGGSNDQIDVPALEGEKATEGSSPSKRSQTQQESSPIDEVLRVDTDELVQKEAETVDQNEQMNRYIHDLGVPMAGDRFNFVEPQTIIRSNDLHNKMDLIYRSLSVRKFYEFSVTDPMMSYPLDAKWHMNRIEKASVMNNTKSIAVLAMEMNYINRSMDQIHKELNITRSVTSNRKNHGDTNRIFDLNAKVSQDWIIESAPPLNEVDLVKTAREVAPTIKERMKTRPRIARFIRAVFKKLIPEELYRVYTVHFCFSSREDAKDIGIRPKEQIIGIVLDLLSLYQADALDATAVHDRAHFTEAVNQLMKSVIYDMRRYAPKRLEGRKDGPRQLVEVMTSRSKKTEEEEEE